VKKRLVRNISSKNINPIKNKTFFFFFMTTISDLVSYCVLHPKTHSALRRYDFFSIHRTVIFLLYQNIFLILLMFLHIGVFLVIKAISCVVCVRQKLKQKQKQTIVSLVYFYLFLGFSFTVLLHFSFTQSY
jgi:hypothetical protein